MIRSSKVHKLLEITLGQLKEVSKQNNIWADMSTYCQDDWKIDFQSLDPYTAVEVISFSSIFTVGYSLVVNVGSMRTYNQFEDSALTTMVFPVLRNITNLIMNNDLAMLKDYTINLTTQRASGCYLYEVKKIDEIIDMPEDIIKIHYY